MSIVPYFNDLERPFRLMERELFRPADDFFGFSPYQVAHRDHFHPQQSYRPWNSMLRSLESMMRPMEQLSAAMNHLGLQSVASNVTSDDEKFQVSVDVQHFAPEEIEVKVVNGQVIVQGNHEEKQDAHGYVSRQFVRKYALPQGCLPDTVESKLSSDGVLTVTAPKVLAMPSTGEKIVPIKHTGPVQKQIGSPQSECKEPTSEL